MALLNKNNGHNYLVSLIILLGVVVLLAAAAFFLAYYLPGIFAVPPFKYEAKEIYRFEPWTFEMDHLKVSYPEGGLVLPLYRNEKQKAAIILAEGEYQVSGEPLAGENPAGIFIVIPEELFEEIRGCVIFLPSEDAGAKQKVMQIYEQHQGLPVIWKETIPLTFIPAADSLYYCLFSGEGEALRSPALIEPPVRLYGSLALYAVLFIIVLLLMTMLSLDHRPSRYWDTLYQTRPGTRALGLAAAALIFALIGELWPAFSGLPAYSLLLGYFPVIALLAFLVYKKYVDIWETGFNWNALRRGYFLAIAAAVMFTVITRGVPQQCSLNNTKTIGGLIFSIFIIGLARELIWHGYIQTMLGRQWGPAAGLLLTALLAGLVHFAAVALGSPEMLSYPYTLVELLILAPGSAVVLGYLYLRTENIFCCALLHGFLLSLSSLIIM